MIRDLLELKERYLFGNDIERHVGKYTCISEPTNGYEEIDEPVVPVKLKEKDKLKIKGVLGILSREEAIKLARAERKKQPQGAHESKPFRYRRPVLCVETGLVFESTTDAWNWHYEVTGLKSDIYTCCEHQSKTRAGFHFR